MVAELALGRGIDQRQPNLHRVRESGAVRMKGRRLLIQGGRLREHGGRHQRGVLGGLRRGEVKDILPRPLRFLSQERERDLTEIRSSGMLAILIKGSLSI